MRGLILSLCFLMLATSLAGCITNPETISDVETTTDTGATNVSVSNHSIAVMNVKWTDSEGNNHTYTSTIEIKLHSNESPIHVDNFVKLADSGQYNGTIFHRIIDDFMIQGGDFTNRDGTGGHAAEWYGYCNGQVTQKDECALENYTIPDEADNGLLHNPCTISMAKTNAAHTGGSQFFLIPEDSTPTHLDGKHTVFGTITSGCDDVTAISSVSTDANDRPGAEVRLESVVIS